MIEVWVISRTFVQPPSFWIIVFAGSSMRAIYDFRDLPSRVFHVKRDCPIIENREIALRMDIVSQIRAAVKPKGQKTALANHMGWHPNVVTNILKGGRRVQVEELPKIQEFLGARKGVRIVGRVAAGTDEIYSTGDDPQEYAPELTNSGPQTVAVEIKGSSLGSALDGWLAYYDDRRAPVTPDLLGRLCVVELQTGQMLIKILRQARGDRFHLLPNGQGEPLLDQKVAWAARVIDLKPKS